MKEATDTHSRPCAGIFVSAMRQGIEDTLEAVYEFIRDYIATYHRSPTIREIADGVYIGRSTVVRYLDRLHAQERIIRTPGQHRSIRLVFPDTD